MAGRHQLEFEVQDALGFIAILQRGRAEKLLSGFNLNYSQFTLLFLLGNDLDKEWTVSGLASHMEMKKSGISKIVSELTDRRWLSHTVCADDRRRKVVRITRTGIKKRQSTLDAMQPFIASTFAGWSASDLQAFLVHLARLKEWLDRHRDVP